MKKLSTNNYSDYFPRLDLSHLLSCDFEQVSQFHEFITNTSSDKTGSVHVRLNKWLIYHDCANLSHQEISEKMIEVMNDFISFKAIRLKKV